MIVLGLNAFGHDAAAVLLVDGAVAFASSQERFDRRKHSAAYPQEAINAALAVAGLDPGDVDAVAFPWSRDMGRWQKVWHVVRRLPRSRAYFRDAADTVVSSRRGYLRSMRGLEQRVRAEGLTAPVHRIRHHEAHAASAALALPGGSGLILTADGMGEWTTAAAWRAINHRVEQVRRADYPHSPGKAYAAVTQWLGFVAESDEGKTMGLAAYGRRDTSRWRFARGLVEHRPDRLIHVRTDAFGFPWGEARLFGSAFTDALGPGRAPTEALREGDADVARGIQDATVDAIAEAALALGAGSGTAPLGVAGGLFLNCAMNGELLRRGLDVRPFPVAGDAGAAWGAAVEVHRRLTGSPAVALGSICLGRGIGDGEARTVADREDMRAYDGDDALADAVAGRIAEGRIVAVARGRAELGPRALGNRSLLASPTTTDSRDRVNQLKGRESWRPLAPIVRLEDPRWFDGQVASPYMILTFDATERARRDVPGVVHVDGTARVQTVAAGENDFLRAVLDALERRGQPPVVINTSFNRRGEPIVNTAEQALASWREMELDTLVLGNHLLDRH